MSSGPQASVVVVAALSVCPGCGSGLVQPLRWQPRPDGEVMVDLRCPECFAWMQALHSEIELEELDRRQTAGREAILSAYYASVAESMEALAFVLREALALDLVGPDDFAPRIGAPPAGGRRP